MSLEVGVLTLGVDVNDRQAIAGLNRIEGRAKASGSRMSGALGAGFGGLAAGVGVVATAGAAALVMVGKDAVSAASNLSETASAVEQIFGPAQAAKIQAWSDTASSAFGQSKQQAMDAANQFATFGKAAGMQGDNLTQFSTQLTGLASDLASFKNTSPEEAITAISAALRGESEPIRKYGVLLDDATLKAEYFAQTGQKVTGTLTPQQKVLAAQASILKQTTDAQGDYIRTSGGLANSQRTLSAVLADTEAKVGQGLLPAITEITKALGPVLQQLAGPMAEVAKTLGGTLADAFKQIAPVLPVFVQNFGKIATTIGGPLMSALGTILPSLMPFLTMAGDLGQRIAPILAQVLGRVAEVLTRVLDAVAPLLQPLMDLVFTILDAAWPIFDVLVNVVLMLVDALKPLLTIVGTLLGPIGMLVALIGDILTPIMQALEPVIGAVATVLSEVLGRALGIAEAGLGGLIKAASYVAPFLIDNMIRPVVSAFSTFASKITSLGASAFSWIPGIGPSIQAAADSVNGFLGGTDSMLAGMSATVKSQAGSIGDTLMSQGLDAAAGKAGKSAAKSYTSALSTGVAGAGSVVATGANLPKPSVVLPANLPSPTGGVGGKSGKSGKTAAKNPVKATTGKSCDKSMQDAVAKGAQEGTERGLENKLDIETPFERTLRSVSGNPALTGKAVNGGMSATSMSATSTAVSGGLSSKTSSSAKSGKSGTADTGDGTVINVTVNANGTASKEEIRKAVMEGIGEAFKRSRVKLTAVGAM